MQYHDSRICSMKRRLYSVRRKHTVQKFATSTAIGQGFQCKEKFCSIRNVISAVGGEKGYSIRRAASAVRKQDVWCEENLCIIGNVAIKVLGEKVCSIRRVASAV